ncbi:glycogen debranching protein [Streptomyces sp. GXMU-J5]|uniref:Glycogen debranching protein n=1 Tax=Streptomyces beihaiensis TaxID=2984495 RepID=A0ABT3TU50_9ACTN|nr:glycogen debranching N-terminal domain-containing protein [Streptomyces beihaiensis]MCX3060559.1 glycogen debranching protein [Streptomyces beihaiensis]
MHRSLVCVALPGLAISSEDGQLTGRGLEGFYRSGRRLLSRCEIRVAGRAPGAVLARMVSADRARFVATVRAAADAGPDPDIVVERTRHADGTERITLSSSAPRPLRIPLEVALGTDLAELGSVAAGRPGRELPATVHDAGMRWSSPSAVCVVAATPAPTDALASAGLLRWELELPPGGAHSVELRVRAGGTRVGRAEDQPAVRPLARAQARGDDPRVAPLLHSCIDDLQGLLVRDPAHPPDVALAAGVPWRCGTAPAEALAAARMTLPLGTRLAVGTLRMLARTQHRAPGPEFGRIPGPLRHTGAQEQPTCTGIEATLLFPVVLAEARRWGLADRDVAELLPPAERCLQWLLAAGRERLYVPDPGPGGPQRCETQAHAHRAALVGADLLDACARPGGSELRQWAQAMRAAFREDFWVEDRAGGRPAALRTPEGCAVPRLVGAAAHLLDTGLLGAGRLAPGLLDRVQTEQLARLLGGPGLDSGWGLRSSATREPSYNPFGHSAGAVRVRETAVAVSGLAAAGYEKEAASLLTGLVGAAEAFGYRLPEMYAGEQRIAGGAPLPHPSACRPAAVAAAAGVHVLATLVGVRPDAPGRTVALSPLRGAPLGEVGLTGLRVAGHGFAARVSRLGVAMVEEAADDLQLGV